MLFDMNDIIQHTLLNFNVLYIAPLGVYLLRSGFFEGSDSKIISLFGCKLLYLL